MLAPSPIPFAVLVSDSPTPCGVETFARRLAARAGSRAVTPILGADPARLHRALDGCRALVVNLPVVAWKRRLVEPVLAMAAARSRGLRTVLVLHEWDDLDWKRRAAYLPMIAAAHDVLFSCPEVEAQFRRSLARRACSGTMGLVPIPPNIARPLVTRRGPASATLAAERGRGRLVIGQFGSIYPKKQPTLVLDVAAELLARGQDPFVVFAGSFIEGSDRVRDTFADHVRRLGLADRVFVTGYIQTDEELFGLFEDVEVFVYAFAEGLTARRASVYACLSSGAPVVVNAPRDAAAFDHHPAYRAALAAGQLRLVPHEAGVGTFADAVVAARGLPHRPPTADGTLAWDAALAAVDAAMSR